MGEEWNKLEKAIDSLNGWAKKKTNAEKEDKKIFHYLGFLIHEGASIASLYEKWVQIKRNKEITQPKQAFATYLFGQIQQKMQSALNKLEDLSYNESSDKRALLAILLLFNMEYHIKKDIGYFQFNRFVLEQWSLEHIYAQNSKSIVAEEELKNLDEKKKVAIEKWLAEVIEHLKRNHTEDEALEKEISKFLKKIPSLENIAKDLEKLGLLPLLKRIDEAFLRDGELHLLQNLTLLDKSSNGALGNLIFSKKQEKIRDLDDQQKLIPICTREVFRKEFSKQERRNLHIFTKEDQEDYLCTLKKYLEEYKTE